MPACNKGQGASHTCTPCAASLFLHIAYILHPSVAHNGYEYSSRDCARQKASFITFDTMLAIDFELIYQQHSYSVLHETVNEGHHHGEAIMMKASKAVHE